MMSGRRRRIGCPGRAATCNCDKIEHFGRSAANCPQCGMILAAIWVGLPPEWADRARIHEPVGGCRGITSGHLERCACDPYDNEDHEDERSTPYPVSEDSRPVNKP